MKILQIIPADNWIATYNEGEQDVPLVKERLVCWALVEGYDGTEGETIVGMVLDGNRDVTWADGQNFEGYFFRPLSG